jgi:adenosylcobinamide-GDP ribazoletransferase
LDRSDIPGGRQAFQPQDLVIALGLLTRLPLPAQAFAASGSRPPAQAAWAYPLVGLVVAVAALLVAWLLGGLGLPAPVQAMFVIAVTVVLTGAMHEDGLADCADGFWGGWTRERRLEIMKDSQIGTYGVIALVLSLVLRWQLITMLIDAGALTAALIPAAMVSRAAMVWTMARLPQARDKGLSRQTGIPAPPALMAAVAIGFCAALFTAGWFATILVSILLTFATGLLARAKIAGQTGDVLGATQQIVEIGCLLSISAFALS